jgi:glycosyltransferase involved in cell wall biosynthesis
MTRCAPLTSDFRADYSRAGQWTSDRREMCAQDALGNTALNALADAPSPDLHPARLLSVLHFSNSLARGGAEEHLLILLRGLDRSRFRLHLACTPELAETIRADVPLDVELVPLRLRKPTQVWSALRLARLILARRVDILHSHLSYGSLFASPIGRLCRVPVIIETPNLNDPAPPRWVAFRSLLDRIVGACVDVSVAVAHANSRHLVTQKRRPPEKISVIHNATDLRRFDPDRAPPGGLKSSLGFRDDDPVLVVVARMQPQKGHRVLLDALMTVRREFPGVRLVCVGDGPLRPDLERRASELGLQQSVRFVGHRTDIPDWLSMADMSVLPSFFEGLPLAAVESLAAGRPVVATEVDGTPEVVIDGVTGLTVPAGDADRLAAAICRLLRDPALRRRLGTAGRQLALQSFGHEQQLSRTQELYQRAWETRARRRAIGSSGRREAAPRSGPLESSVADDVRAELTRARLERVGSGFEKIVLGSPRWVVKIPRGDRGFVAALLATAVVARARHRLGRWSGGGRRWPPGPAPRRWPAAPWGVRAGWNLLQLGLSAALTLVPERIWRASGAGRRARWLRTQARRCEQVAVRRLEGTPLVPRRVELPPTRIRDARWGRRMTVTTAFQRVDRTLLDEARRCARLGRCQELERWLDCFLAFQTDLWRRGVFFGVSNPFENHGVLGERVVLIDYSGLIDDPRKIRGTLETVRARWLESAAGLCAPVPPGSGEAFEQKLGEMLQPSVVRRYWPTPDDPRWDS